MNNVEIIGNLTKDPQKVDGIDKKLCKLSVAVNEDYVKEDGTRPVDFFTVIVWGKPAENCVKYLKKGSKVGVVGKLKNRSWDGADGKKQYTTEIMASYVEYLNTKPTAPTESDEPTVFEEKKKQTAIFDDDLPF